MATLSLFADLEQLAAIHKFIAQTGHDLHLDDKTQFILQLVVDEACTNVIEHAYGGQGGKMNLTIEVIDSCVQVTIRDWGMPFDPEEIPVPDVTAPLEQRPLGGLGLYLMQEMMDRVDFRFDAKDGNTLIMVKQLQDLSLRTK